MKKSVFTDKPFGQELMEFALTMPVLLLLVIGIFDIGRAVYYYSALHNAAREGARYGVIYPEDVTGIQTAARQLAVGLEATKLTVPAPTYPDAQHLRVCASYLYEPVMPLIADLFGAEQITLQSCATMFIER